MEKFKYEIEIENNFEKIQNSLKRLAKYGLLEEDFAWGLSSLLSPYAYKKFQELYTWDINTGEIIKKKIVSALERFTFENPFALSSKRNSGVYLILQANLNYETDELMYTCKIGESHNLHNRINQYHTYNTGFYHNDMSIVITDEKKRKEFETAAQNGLIKMGYNQVCGRSSEWFLIDKEMFYAMKKNGVEILKELAAM